MSNSSLISYTKLSPNCNKPRNHKIDTITIHCMAGNMTVESCGAMFAQSSRQASSNYGIGTDGRIALYVDEANRSWCSSSSSNDHRAVTIEVANTSASAPYPVSDKAYAALIDLVTDICKRNGIEKLVWSTSKSDRVNHLNGCNMTVHRDYANKSCPGDYLYSRHAAIADAVNARLGSGTSSSTSSVSFSVGDVVSFTGTKHYTTANSTSGSTCKPGKAKVTAISKLGKHPYHLIHTDSTSNVYGWVDAGDIGGTATSTSGTIAVGSSVKVNSGAKTYTGGSLASFVYKNTYTVMQLSGNRAVIGTGGAITAAVKLTDLTLA